MTNEALAKRKGDDMDANIHYMLAKLEAIHEDVSLLKKQVDELRHVETGKKAVSRFVIGALAIIGATVGWLVDNAITVAQHLEYRE